MNDIYKNLECEVSVQDTFDNMTDPQKFEMFKICLEELDLDFSELSKGLYTDDNFILQKYMDYLKKKHGDNPKISIDALIEDARVLDLSDFCGGDKVDLEDVWNAAYGHDQDKFIEHLYQWGYMDEIIAREIGDLRSSIFDDVFDQKIAQLFGKRRQIPKEIEEKLIKIVDELCL